MYERLLSRLQAHYPDGEGLREFVRILRLHQRYPADLIKVAVEQSLEFNCAHADGVELCLRQLQQPDPVMSELDLSDHPKLSAVGRQQVNLGQYDTFLGGGLCQ